MTCWMPSGSALTINRSGEHPYRIIDSGVLPLQSPDVCNFRLDCPVGNVISTLVIQNFPGPLAFATGLAFLHVYGGLEAGSSTETRHSLGYTASKGA